MRLPRRPIGRSVVSELQSQRAAAISPGEAAQAELAKFGAIAGVAGAVGGVLETVSDVRREAQAAKDEITYQTGESNLKTAFKSLDNDPNLRKPVQDDGTPTADYYQRESEAILKTYREHLDNIVEPKAKLRAESLAGMRVTEFRADAEGQIGVIETRIAGDELYTGFTTALRSGDMEGARALIQIGKERLLLDPEAAEKWTIAVEKEEIKTEAATHVDHINEGFAISDEEGKARLSALIKDTSIDKDVRNLAVNQGEELATEWGKARAKETEQAEVQAIIAFGDDKAAASRSEKTYEQIDAGFAGDKYGDHNTVGAAQRRNQLIAAVTAGIKTKESVLDVSASIQNGQFIINDKKSRDALSMYEAGATEGMDGQEQIQTIGDISRIAGTVSTQTSRMLNLSAVSQGVGAQVLPLYRELISERGLKPDMHLDPMAETFLEDASVLVDGGMSIPEATEVAWGNRDITENQRIDRSITWKDSGISAAGDGYKELIDSDMYEEPGFGDVDDPPTLMAVEYSAVFREVFAQTGNPVTAKNLADRATQRNWVMTNFNSANPKEFTVQKFGIPGDSRQVRKAVIAEIEQEPFWKASMDADKVTFQTFNEKSDAFDIDGNQRFKVIYDGKPLSRVSDNGVEVATITIDRSRQDEFSKASNERDQMQQRLDAIEEEEKRLSGQIESNIYATVMPKRTAKRAERKAALAKERKKLKESLPPTVHF